MKKNKCTYLDCQNRCTHRLSSLKKRSNSKSPDCPFNNELKCQMYKEWERQRKSLRMAENDDKALIKTWMEQMKQRWNK